jgi:hypothetical protein
VLNKQKEKKEMKDTKRRKKVGNTERKNENREEERHFENLRHFGITALLHVWDISSLNLSKAISTEVYSVPLNGIVT